MFPMLIRLQDCKANFSEEILLTITGGKYYILRFNLNAIVIITYWYNGAQLSINPHPLTKWKRPLDHFCKHRCDSLVSLLQGEDIPSSEVSIDRISSFSITNEAVTETQPYRNVLFSKR